MINCAPIFRRPTGSQRDCPPESDNPADIRQLFGASVVSQSHGQPKDSHHRGHPAQAEAIATTPSSRIRGQQWRKLQEEWRWGSKEPPRSCRLQEAVGLQSQAIAGGTGGGGGGRRPGAGSAAAGQPGGLRLRRAGVAAERGVGAARPVLWEHIPSRSQRERSR